MAVHGANLLEGLKSQHPFVRFTFFLSNCDTNQLLSLSMVEPILFSNKFPVDLLHKIKILQYNRCTSRSLLLEAKNLTLWFFQ